MRYPIREYQNDSPSALSSLDFLAFKQPNTAFKNLLDWSNHITMRGMDCDGNPNRGSKNCSVPMHSKSGNPIAFLTAGLVVKRPNCFLASRNEAAV